MGRIMVYGYLRVSTGKQDSENQKIGVERLAAHKNLVIEKYITDEGVSGTKEPEKRMLGILMAELNPGDIIIASELSRLGRSMFMVMRILEFCMKHGVKVYTAKDNYELGDNIQSKVLAFAFGLAAEIERDMISQRTKEALERKKKEGVILGRPHGVRAGETKLTQHHDEIIMYLHKGQTYSAIARLIGVHRMTVTSYCQQHNLTGLKKIYPNRNHAELTTDTRNMIVAMIKNGKTKKQIAEITGMGVWKLDSFLRQNKDLDNELLARQSELRIKANGSLSRSKDREKNLV